MWSLQKNKENAPPKKVDFLVCGTQKGGTSALDNYLRDNPQICMGNEKELHFFDDESNFVEKKVDYKKYHACFTPTELHKIIGECTPIYMYWYDAPRRIWEYNKQIKIIIMLRNPINRAYSHWNMEVARKYETLSFDAAIKSERARCREALPLQHRVYSYVDRGFYCEQLRRVLHFFPQEQVLILKNEDLKVDPNNTLKKVCDFLEVDFYPVQNEKNIHSLPYEADMSNETRLFLRALYENEILSLERMLGWDCSSWLSVG